MIWPESLCHPEHQSFRHVDLPRRSSNRPLSALVFPSSHRTGRRCCHRRSRPHRSCILRRSPRVPPRFRPKLEPQRICSLACGCASGIREFRRRFGPARSEERNRSYHHSVETCASQRRPIQCNRLVRFHSEIVLLGIVGHFRSYFSHPNLELRVILNSWKTPPPLRP